MTRNPHFEFFAEHASALEQHQRAVLDAMLASFAQSGYARSLEATELANAEDYTRHVPLVRFEDIRPWIERIDSEADSLSAERTLAFFKTSGSTSKPKLIPVTPSLMRQKMVAFAIFWGMIYRDYPEVATGRLVSNFIDAGQPEVSASGIEVCSESNFWSRRGRSMNSMQRWPLPAELRLVDDLHARLYAVARLLLQSELHCIMCLNPSTLLQFCRVIQQHAPALMRGLESGTWGTSDQRILEHLQVKGKVSLASYLEVDTTAVERLAGAIDDSSTPQLLSIWPMLKLIVCWRSNMVKPYFSQLAGYVAGVPMRDYISQSSECMMAIPIADFTSGGALAYTSHFFEFIKESDINDACAKTLFAWQVKEFERYELVVTTGGGLYRYRTGDCVRVTGFYQQVPTIEFLYRLGKTSSITGEKLTEQHVLDAAAAASIELAIAPYEYLCYPVSGQDPHYAVMLEWEEGADDQSAVRWCEVFNNGLIGANSEYADKCASGRLGPVATYRVNRGALRAARQVAKAEGVSDEQVKNEVLTSRLDCHKYINSARLLDSGRQLRAMTQ